MQTFSAETTDFPEKNMLALAILLQDPATSLQEKESVAIS